MRMARVVLLGALVLAAACESLLTTPTPYGRVSVQVQSRSGLPLAGLRAELYTSAYPLAYLETDADGRVTFERVPRGAYGVKIHLTEDYADLSELSADAPGTTLDDILVRTGSDTTLQFTFALRGPGSIEARVRDQYGLAMPNIRVGFYNTLGVFAFRFTDAAGIARADSAPFGAYGSFVFPPDSLGIPNAAGIFRDGFVVDREVVPRAQFTLNRCLGRISARLLDQNDAPVVAARMEFYNSSTMLLSVFTDTFGRANFEKMNCGNYGVRAVEVSGDYSITNARGFGFQDGIAIVDRSDASVTLRATKLP